MVFVQLITVFIAIFVAFSLPAVFAAFSLPAVFFAFSLPAVFVAFLLPAVFFSFSVPAVFVAPFCCFWLLVFYMVGVGNVFSCSAVF